MNLIKTSLLSSITTIIKVFAGIISNKIVAIFVGPSGIALLGNFVNMTSILSNLSNGSISSGLTKYISEFDSEEDKKRVISHGIKINLFFSFILGFIIIIFNKFLSNITFNDPKYFHIYVIFGLTIVFYGLNTTITAILNGYKFLKYLITTSILASIITLIFSILLTIKYGLLGAIINTMASQICTFLVNILILKKLDLIKYVLRYSLDRFLLWKLFKFSLMSISSLSILASLFLLRKYIYTYFSPTEAGYIQGIWTISNNYLLVITTSLSIYYLPTLSSIKDSNNIRKEILKGYKYLIPFTLICGLFIYIFRELIIKLLFSPDFIQMKKYFLFQLVGDFFKVSSWILSYLMVAKAMTKYFMLSEILFSILYLVIGISFMKIFGIVGITYAYSFVYLLYFLFTITLFRNTLFINSNKLG